MRLTLTRKKIAVHTFEKAGTHVKYGFAPSTVKYRGFKNPAAVNCRGKQYYKNLGS
jgi:hypothetical protein